MVYVYRYAVVSAVVVSTWHRLQSVSSFHTAALTAVRHQRTYTTPRYRRPYMLYTAAQRPIWLSRHTRALQYYTTLASSLLTDDDSPAFQLDSSLDSTDSLNAAAFPLQDTDGIYEIQSKEQHLALLQANPDKIVIVKFFAPWCRACKAVEPKFIQISKEEKYVGLPLVFAQLSIQHSKDYVKNLGILALPSVQMYAGEFGLVESFPCGPSKIPILKKKIAQVVNEHVDPTSLQLKKPVETAQANQVGPECDLNTQESIPCTERQVVPGVITADVESQLRVGDVVVSEQMMKYLRFDVPFFKDFTNEEFQGLMDKAKYVTFESGSVIMRQGNVGKTFYVIDSGSVEILVKGSALEQAMKPSGYLGTVINRLSKLNYFGERSLITGQPRAASIRAVEKTRCFAFDVEDMPDSTVLSGKRNPSPQRLEQVNEKYGLDLFDLDDVINNQYKAASVATQVRGSVNNPRIIRGVDTDEDVNAIFATTENDSVGSMQNVDNPEFMVSSTSSSYPTSTSSQHPLSIRGNDDMILSLLIRFKLLRHASRCFEYILQTSPKWGDVGELKRRSLLVSKLTAAQRDEFTDVFRMIDKSGDGKISVLELKNALNTIDDERSEEEIKEMINKADPSVEGNSEISYSEFMGVMAEADFYFLFKDTFSSLDKDKTGYVQAGKLDKVLDGLRDLISDDRMSIIDVDDKDMLIDYETFSRMMIGTH